MLSHALGELEQTIDDARLGRDPQEAAELRQLVDEALREAGVDKTAKG
jgi:hypothetical protein